MKKRFTYSTLIFLFVLIWGTNAPGLQAQSWIIGAPDPTIGASASFTALVQWKQFNVMHPDGVIIDSCDIYPTSGPGSPFTIVIQNSSQQVIASYSGTTTVTSGLPQRIHLNLLIPPGTGYRWGFSVNPGMLRNSTGAVYPYEVPGVMSITGNTFNVVYYYFFYNIRIRLPIYNTDAALTRMTAPADTTCSGVQPVSVLLKNMGPSDLNFAELHWRVNSVVQPVLNWTGSIGVGDSLAVVLGQYNFQTGTTYAIEANVFEPNGFHDSITHNDTVQGMVEFVKPSPEAALTVPGTIAICQGDSVSLTGTLTGTGPWHLTLKEGQTTHQYPGILSSPFSLTFHPVSTTNYILTTVSDATGCSSEIHDTVQVLVTPQPPAAITPPSPSAICAGDSIVLMGSVGAGFSYEWYKDGVLLPGITSFTMVAKDPGDYTVKVTSPVGCSKLSQPHQLIVNPLPTVSLGNDTAVLPGITLMLDAGAGFNTYLWSTGEITQAINVDSTGVGIGLKTIWVEVTDNFSCKGRDEITINFTPHPGIRELVQGAQLSVYPNPGQGVFSLRMEGLPEGVYQLEVSGVGGRVVYRKPIHYTLQGENIMLDMSPLASGTYFLTMNGTHGAITTKIVIQK